MIAEIKVSVHLLPHGRDMPLPSYSTSGSSGLDLLAAIEEEHNIGPGERCLIPCGICLALPEGFEAQIRPRSGLALKHGISIINSPGTIDADYRGEIGAILINYGKEAFVIRRGMRIAQMVIAPIVFANLELVEILPNTSRGTKGFGSTGVGN